MAMRTLQQFPPLESVTRPTTNRAPATYFTPLHLETRVTVSTETAAYHLNRRPQTLRIWAMKEHPIRPVRVHGRLAWPVSELKRLLGVPA